MNFLTEPQLASAKAFQDLPRTSPSRTEPVPKNSFRRSFTPLLVLLLAGYFATLQLSKWPERLRYPGEEDAAEGTQLSEMVHLREGIQIYRVPSGETFDSAIYGPLCYLLGSAVINPQVPSYLPLRLLSLAATLGLIAAAGLFVYKLTGKIIAVAVVAALLTSTIFIARYGISARADMVALLLAFSGFLLFYCFRNSRSALLVSAALMLLSFYYKQQFVGAPSAVFAYLVVARRFRAALEFVVVMTLGWAALAALFSFAVFPHQAFLMHFISYNHLPFDKSLVVPEILMFVIPLFVPLLGSADFVDHQSDKLVTCYVVISVAAYFLLLFSSGSGADTNRCLEPALVLSCVFAARIATTERVIPALAWTAALAFTLLLVALLPAAFVVPEVKKDDFGKERAIQSYLRKTFSSGTKVLTYYPGDPLRAGLQVPITNLWHYSALIHKGTLSDRDIVANIDRHGYGAILLDFDLNDLKTGQKADFYTTASMRDAVRHRYAETARLRLPGTQLTRFTDGYLHVWVPRSSDAN